MNTGDRMREVMARVAAQVIVRLDDEKLAALPIGDDVYRLDDVPTTRFNLGDLVRCDSPSSEDTLPIVRELLQRGEQRKFAFDPIDLHDGSVAGFLEKVPYARVMHPGHRVYASVPRMEYASFIERLLDLERVGLVRGIRQWADEY